MASATGLRVWSVDYEIRNWQRSGRPCCLLFFKALQRRTGIIASIPTHDCFYTNLNDRSSCVVWRLSVYMLRCAFLYSKPLVIRVDPNPHLIHPKHGLRRNAFRSSRATIVELFGRPSCMRGLPLIANVSRASLIYQISSIFPLGFVINYSSSPSSSSFVIIILLLGRIMNRPTLPSHMGPCGALYPFS